MKIPENQLLSLFHLILKDLQMSSLDMTKSIRKLSASVKLMIVGVPAVIFVVVIILGSFIL